MNTRFKSRAAVVFVVAALVSSLGLWATAPGASAANAGHRIQYHRSGHALHGAANAAGTYEWFVIGTSCSGGDCGQIVINSNGTWFSKSFCDTGSWLAQKTTIALSDLLCGSDPYGETFMGTIGKHGISSSKKPGNWVIPSGAATGTWYAVKL